MVILSASLKQLSYFTIETIREWKKCKLEKTDRK